MLIRIILLYYNLRLDKKTSLVISNESAGWRSNEKSIMLAIILIQGIPAGLVSICGKAGAGLPLVKMTPENGFF